MRHLLSLILFLVPHILWAASIQTVKGTKVLIQLDGQSVSAGERYFTLDSAGKKKAIVTIRQVKGDKAVAEISKGKAEVGHSLSATPSQSAAAPTSSGRSSVERVGSYSGGSWGLLASVLQSTMTAEFYSGTTLRTTAMKGTSFGALGFYDYPFSPDLQLRAAAGAEMFSVTGTVDGNYCTSSTTCDVKITYLSMYGGGKYNVYRGNSVRIYGAASYGFLMALSKSSTVLKTAEISTNQLYVFTGGLDYVLDRNSYLPLTLDYGMFPASSTVKSTVLFIRFGWAKTF